MSFSGASQAQGSDDGQHDDRLALLEKSPVVMAVVEHGKHVAFAAYDEATNTILLEGVSASAYNLYLMIEHVVAMMRPTLLLLSSKMCGNDLVLQSLCTPHPIPGEGSLPAGSAPTLEPTPYKLLKTSCFDVRTCKASMMQLHVESLMRQNMGATRDELRHQPTNNGQAYKMSAFHSLSTVIDFDNTAQVQAVGSLLSFLENSTLRCVQDGRISLHNIRYVNASLYMMVSADAFSALNIFSTEHHPLVAAKGSGSSKEGSSLFSLLDYTKSRSGRAKLREWMLMPLTNIEAIRQRQDGVALFLLPDMLLIGRRLFRLMEKVGVVDRILQRVQKCSATCTDYLALCNSLSSATSIVEILDELLGQLHQHVHNATTSDSSTGHSPGSVNTGLARDLQARRYIDFIENLLHRCSVPSLADLHLLMSRAIDTETSLSCNDLVIRPGFNDELDNLKNEYIRLDETMRSATTVMRQSMPHGGRDMKIVYMPQVGFLVETWNQPGLGELLTEDFTFLFAEDERVFFKNNETGVLDNDVGDLAVKLRDVEAFIVAELEDCILDKEDALRHTFDALAELDCILAFAAVAAQEKYTRPDVLPATEHCIHIVNGRHPLQEIISGGGFIPNDTTIDASNRVSIITGPNFSGKSCYARQVGLLVYMAQIGSFIPCDAARISISDQIFAHFSSAESCSVPQSSFQLDLTKMGSILRRVTSRSLVIVDEFGKGTSPASGIALLSAAIKNFCKANCKVVCTTHFLELFNMGLVTDGIHGIKASRMAVRIPETIEDTAVPLFTIEDGVASSSAGIACARMAGVKEAVIVRAHEVVAAVKNRRKVHPLMEILRKELDLSSAAKNTVLEFIDTNWARASDSDINQFVSRVDQTLDINS